jgi:hypothetical protein
MSMVVKAVKSGYSIKMDDETWEVIRMAFDQSIILNNNSMEPHEFSLSLEVRKKLLIRKSQAKSALKLRESEMLILFRDETMSFVHESLHPLFNEMIEPVRRKAKGK